jgi:Zn finger protein HypA/HybF involved in hydrogenase expression
MHNTHIMEDILRYLKQEEKQSGRKIKKIYISLSRFGTLTKEHFLQHFEAASADAWRQALKVEIKEIPFGKELEITRIDFIEAGSR